MMAAKVHILVEGQTEEIFVRRTLQAYVGRSTLWLNPVIVKTRQKGSAPAFRGGEVKYSEFKMQVNNLLHDSSAALVTTLLDYYALPADYPKRRGPVGSTAAQKASCVERAIEADLGNPSRLQVHLTVHDFEGPLFADVGAIADQFEDRQAEPQAWARLQRALISEQAGREPEEINDSPETCPSARLKRVIPNYRKTIHSTAISERIGVLEMANRCPHFRTWIERLQSLSIEN
jgi:hypothetical protein